MRISDWSSDVCSSDLPGWMASCAHPSDSETPQGMTVQPRSRKSRLLGLLPSRLVMTRLPSRGKLLYLTFDDGPDPEPTPRVLDILKRHGASASVFLVGTQLQRHSEEHTPDLQSLMR